MSNQQNDSKAVKSIKILIAEKPKFRFNFDFLSKRGPQGNVIKK